MITEYKLYPIITHVFYFSDFQITPTIAYEWLFSFLDD